MVSVDIGSKDGGLPFHCQWKNGLWSKEGPQNPSQVRNDWKSADPSLRGSAPRSLVCVCLVPDHTPAGVRVFRKRSFSTCCATFRHFFYLLFRMAWVRIWMLFECFGSASPRALEAGDSSFLVRSVGDVSAVFRAAVSHGLGTYSLGINPAAVPLFRKRFSKSFLFRMVWASILLAFLRVP